MLRVLILIPILFALATPAASPEPMPMTGSVEWTTSLGEHPYVPPLPYQDLVLMTAGTTLLAVDMETGQTAWSAVIPTQASGYLRVVNGAVVVTGRGGTFTVFDVQTGEQIASHVISASMLSSTVELNGYLYTADDEGTLFEIDPETWESRIVMALPDHVVGTPRADGDSLLLGLRDGSVASIDPSTEVIEWRTPFANAVVEVLAVDDSALAVATTDGQVTLLNTEDGSSMWDAFVSRHQIVDLSIGPDTTLLATDTAGSLVVMDAVTGKARATDALSDRAWFGSDMCDASCHVLGADGSLYRFDGETFQLEVITAVPAPAGPGAEHQGVFYLMTRAGDCYAIRLEH